jgi:ABC-type multidrug transport system ATPase subunit
MLRFSVELKVMPVPGETRALVIEERVQELVSIMNLTKCKNRIIPQYPTLRGEEGGDIRRLSISMEIARMPPIIVIHEPTLNLGPAFALNIMQCLKTISEKGHVVICSMSKVYPTEVDLVDRIVMLSEGYSIYASSPRRAQPFFCNNPMSYEFKKGTELMDFLMDVSSGVERPVRQREADLPVIMQEKYEMSDYFEHFSASQEAVSAFSEDFFKLWGYGKFDPPLYAYYRIKTVMKRSIYTKFRDFENIKSCISTCLFVGLICGYLQYDQGSYGHFTLALVGFPYANTANIAGLMFFITAFTWAFPFLSVHVICQKLQLYRYELNSRCCTTFAMVLGTIVSEIPFSIAYIFIFANLIYWMSDFGKGASNYWFFVEILCLHGIVGTMGAYLYGAIFRKELLVRDLFILTVSIVALISGFPFQLTSMTDYLASASVVNPWRWCFESLMSYKFLQYDDGVQWLTPYGFQNFDHNFGKHIMGNFILITGTIMLIFLTKEPIVLKRKKAVGKSYGASESRDSVLSVDVMKEDEDMPRRSTRQSELVKPLVFMRESSVTGRASKLSINVSQMGEENMDRGPTVMFKDVSFRMPDNSPMGYKTILQRVSGKFDWGKLTMVMGATKSGKSSLLHLLAGDVCIGAQISGKILFDGREPPADQPLWQRCGFVPATSDHYRDLTAMEVLQFAAKLRCLNRLGLKYIEENVTRTVEILHLSDSLGKKTKKLTPGELKRLSIAEEMVAGPKLLIMDEPTTGVNIYEVVVLLQTFREMVNQDRTVIASIHEPTAEVFKLFDSLYLLSKGRVIYQGPIHNAINFFISSPFSFDYRNYTNPADFLTDISGGFISDSKGEFIDSSILENHYMTSEGYLKLQQSLKAKMPKAAGTGISDFDSENPLMKYGASPTHPAMRAKHDERGSTGGFSDSGNHPGQSIEIENSDPSAMNGSGLNQKKQPHIALLMAQEVLAETFKPHFFYIFWYFFKYCYALGAGKPNPSKELEYYPALWNETCNLFFKGGILFHRSVIALARRHELLVTSEVVHIFLALMFGWIMGPSNDTAGIYNTNSFFAVGSMFLMIANVVFVFYMFNSSQVFLKEYSRGLYGNFLRWITTDYPLYTLRMVNAVTFISIAWGMTEQTTDPGKFILQRIFFLYSFC